MKNRADTVKQSRDYSFDNIKFILIFLVVFGHLLEIFKFPHKTEVYQLIYSFHMPLFIFISGYFAKFDRKSIMRNLVAPYAVFQVFYIMFDMHVLKSSSVDRYQFTTPYWILWYMLALIFYTVLIPMYDVKSTAHRVAAVAVAIMGALYAGYDTSIGYMVSLSRFLVFQPYFLMGFYWRRERENFSSSKKMKPSLRIVLYLSVIAVTLCALWVVFHTKFTNSLLYSSASYKAAKQGASMRGMLVFVAVSMILFFMVIAAPILNRKIPVISKIGENSLSVFLLHGFVMRWCRQERYEFLKEPLYLVLFALGLVVVLGNPLVGRAVKYIFRCEWIDGLARVGRRIIGKKKS